MPKQSEKFLKRPEQKVGRGKEVNVSVGNAIIVPPKESKITTSVKIFNLSSSHLKICVPCQSNN